MMILKFFIILNIEIKYYFCANYTYFYIEVSKILKVIQIALIINI